MNDTMNCCWDSISKNDALRSCMIEVNNRKKQKNILINNVTIGFSPILPEYIARHIATYTKIKIHACQESLIMYHKQHKQHLLTTSIGVPRPLTRQLPIDHSLHIE